MESIFEKELRGKLLKNEKVILLDSSERFFKLNNDFGESTVYLSGHFLYQKSHKKLTTYCVSRKGKYIDTFFFFYVLELIYLHEKNIYLFIYESALFLKDEETRNLFELFLHKAHKKNIYTFFN